MQFQIVTAPSSAVVSLAEAKAHLRAEHTDDDALIASLVNAATELVESHTSRQFVTATWKLYLDHFPRGDIEVRKSPVASVSSITYYDENDSLQTWATDNYQVDVVSEPARIRPSYNVTWPSTRSQKLNAVTVTFVAGTSVDNVPDMARHAVLLLVSHWYENTEAVSSRSLRDVPFAVQALVNALKWTDYR